MSLYKLGDYVVFKDDYSEIPELAGTTARIGSITPLTSGIYYYYKLCDVKHNTKFVNIKFFEGAFDVDKSKKLNDFCDKINEGDYLVISENATDTSFRYTEETLKHLALKANQAVQVITVYNNRLFKVEGIDSVLTVDVFVPNVIIKPITITDTTIIDTTTIDKNCMEYCKNDVKIVSEQYTNTIKNTNKLKYHVGDKVIITKDISILVPKGKLAEIAEIKLNSVNDIKPIEYKLSIYGLYSDCFVTDDYFTKVEGNSYKPSLIGTFIDENDNEKTLMHLHIDKDSIETWEDVTVPNTTEDNYTILNVGDIICISPYITGGNVYDEAYFGKCMEKYRCQLANITEVIVRTNSNGKPFALYKLDIDDGKFNWTNSMFSNVIHNAKSRNINDNIKEENKMNKARYKVGDKVVIRADLESKRYGDTFVTTDMASLKGKTATITDIYKHTNIAGFPIMYYKINDMIYRWTDEMFEPTKNTLNTDKEENKMNKARYKVGDIIRIKRDLKGDTYYGSEYVAPAMASLKGKIATITYVGTAKNIAGVQYFYYHIDLNNYSWTEEMFDNILNDIFKGNYDNNTKEEKKMIVDFKTVNSERYVSYGKHDGATIPQTTTEVTLPNGKKGRATIDTNNYNEREGILNAIANAVYDGNFDKVYDATKKAEANAKAKADKENRTCKYCGIVYDTVEEKEECVKAHIQRKKDKKEAYAIRKEAERRLNEAIRENRIEAVMQELLAKYETVEDEEVNTDNVEDVENNVETESVENVENNVENNEDIVNEGQ